MRSLVSFGLFVCSVSLLCAADADILRAHTALAQLPLRFEENRGQFRPSVRYGARAGGYTLQLSAGGAALAMPGAQRVEMALVKANPAAAIAGLDRMPARTDYFLGSRLPLADRDRQLLARRISRCLSGDRRGLLRQPAFAGV